jgi:uncharacterized membrane protein
LSSVLAPTSIEAGEWLPGTLGAVMVGWANIALITANWSRIPGIDRAIVSCLAESYVALAKTVVAWRAVKTHRRSCPVIILTLRANRVGADIDSEVCSSCASNSGWTLA